MNGRTQPEVVEVMQFLADHGAKLDEMNAAGRTPICDWPTACRSIWRSIC